MRRYALLGAMLLALCPTPAVHAVDQPLPGQTVTIKRAARETFKLVLRDPSILVPAPGSADDPSQHGLTVQLFGHSTPGEMAELAVPGLLGWKVQASPLRYSFSNSVAPGGPSPVRALQIRGGKGLKIVARVAGLALTTPQYSVGVRVQMGSTRLCALFDAPAVRRDAPGVFMARNADVPGLAACTDEGLSGNGCSGSPTCGGLCPGPNEECAFDFGGGCVCISGAQPCGGTAPACNGECPDGQACANVGGVPYSACACLPTGTTGCGETATCGGGCPGDLSCNSVYFTCCGGVIINGCGCTDGPPPPPCGGPCPPGLFCAGAAPGFPEGCYPTNCSGGSACPTGAQCSPLFGGMYCTPTACTGGSGYPTCDGSCDPGLTCKSFAQSGGACYCAP